MIVAGIDNVAQSNNAYAHLTWAASAVSDHVTGYVISYFQDTDPSHIYTAVSPRPSVKIGGLFPGVNYWFTVQAQNSDGQLSPLLPYQEFQMPLDTVAPAMPLGLVATSSLRGAWVACQPNTEPDLQGYLFQVSINGAPFQPVNAAPQLASHLNYQAPPGTPVGASLSFQVAAIDWSGNVSPWAPDPNDPASDDLAFVASTAGVPFDEIVAGNLTVYGTIQAGGGIQTAATGQRVTIDESGVTLYDNSQTDYGAGVGVTVKLNAETGGGFFSGQLIAASLLTGGIQSGVGQNIPALPAGFTGFQLDPVQGLCFYNSGVLQSQFAPSGEIDIFSGANLNVFGGTITGTTVQASTLIGNVLQSPPGTLPGAVFDLTGVPNIVFTDMNGVNRVLLGEYISAIDGSPQFGMQGMDATGKVTFDTQGQHVWTSAIDQTANREMAATPIASLSNGVPLPTSVINVNSTFGFGPSGALMLLNSVGQLQVVLYTGITATSFTGCTGGAGNLFAGTLIWLVYQNGPYRRTSYVTVEGHTTFAFGQSGGVAYSTLAGQSLRVGTVGIQSAPSSGTLDLWNVVAIPCDPLGYYGIQPTGNNAEPTTWIEVDF